LLATGRFLQRRQPEPGRKVAPDAEVLGGRHKRGDRGGGDWPDARDCHQPPCGRIFLRAPINFAVQLVYLCLHCSEGVDQQLENSSRVVGQSRVRIFDVSDQSCRLCDALGEDVAILGKVPTQGVDALGALAHQEIARSEHNAVRLLLLALDRNKAHARPLRCFTDGLGIGRVFFCRLTNGLT
jgi:hypothetical protein